MLVYQRVPMGVYVSTINGRLGSHGSPMVIPTAQVWSFVRQEDRPQQM
jgi:hypothetical protein